MMKKTASKTSARKTGYDAKSGVYLTEKTASKTTATKTDNPLIQATRLLLFSLPERDRNQLMAEAQGDWRSRFQFIRHEIETEVHASKMSIKDVAALIDDVRKSKSAKSRRA